MWINLEYLTAEPFAERSHGLPSPVMAGPAAGLTKHFFYPGFTARSGGLLREQDLCERQARFDRAEWLRRHGIAQGTAAGQPVLLRAAPVAAVAAGLGGGRQRVAAAGNRGPGRRRRSRGHRGQRPAAARVERVGRLAFTFLPLLPQPEFDHLLWSCDINFVRGEDSLVRALWAGRPFVWHIYPQHDDAHHAKLRRVPRLAGGPARVARVPRCVERHPRRAARAPSISHGWSACVQDARRRLLSQDDLVTRLLRFAASQSPLR